MKTKINLNRRSFLQNLALFTGGSSLLSSYGKLQLIQSALAAPGNYADLTDYKSLVCVFFGGGYDALNTFIPNTDTEYQSYASLRRHLAIERSDLELITGGSHGFHPALSNIRDLYDTNKLAMIANTGNLFQPITREEYFDFYDNNANVNVPPDLFAHDKQQEILHTGLAPEAGSIHPGWGGRLVDLLSTANTNPDAPPAYTIAGNNPWQASVNERNRSYGIASGAPVFIDTFQRFAGEATFHDPLRASRSEAWDSILNLSRTDPLQAHTATAFLDTRRRANLLRNALQQNSISIQTPLPGGNGLATQLRAVAEMISIREALGLKRQTFFVSLSGGWDTHKAQITAHAGLLPLVNNALFSFQNTLEELGVENSVTTFTASEFGRTLTINGNNGTDHAWATDYMVMGGAVNGGQIYGDQIQYSDVPEGQNSIGEQLFGPQDVGSGRFIPKYSTDQYGATLARWMDVTDSDLSLIFPNLDNFAIRDLGFMSS